MPAKNLEELLQSVTNPVDLLRNQQTGPNVYPGVPAEYTNWRDEQQAWQKTCVLFNQSYHMADLAVDGPDAFKLLVLSVDQQLQGLRSRTRPSSSCRCTPDGYVIGDVILFYLAENKFNLVGRAPALELGRVPRRRPATTTSRSSATSARRCAPTARRKSYRFQVQGPNAMKVIAKAIGKTPPELKFFNMTHADIAGKNVSALRHGMAGQPGCELFGPWDDGEAVHEALVEAGEEFGLRLVGGRAYSSNTLESGWIPSPLPAIYTGDESMKAYPRSGCRPTATKPARSIGGSFVPDNIEDYYLTPWDIGYGHFVKFDHDFIGREALEKMANEPAPPEGHAGARQRGRHAGDRLACSRRATAPSSSTSRRAVYSMHPFDQVTVRRQDGRRLDLDRLQLERGQDADAWRCSTPDYAEPGKEVTFVWGEPNGGTTKPTVEPHVQTRDPGDRQPGAVCRSGAQGLCPGRLARGFGVGGASGWRLFVSKPDQPREPAQAPPNEEDAERDHAGKQRENRAVGGERHQCVEHQHVG